MDKDGDGEDDEAADVSPAAGDGILKLDIILIVVCEDEAIADDEVVDKPEDEGDDEVVACC